jgi:DNA-binding CsgD family transcriptional regulator
MINEPELSEREREILQLVATGASNKQIAQQLYISANTVKVHMRNIFAKIDVASRTEATLYAIREGIVAASTVLPAESGNGRMDEELAHPLTEVIPPTILPIGGKTKMMTGMVSLVLIVALGVLGISLRQYIFPAVTVQPPPQATPIRWESRAPLPEARSGLAAAVYDGQIYAIAGETEQGVTGVVTRFNPTSDTWETLASKPVPVTDVKAALVGEKIYIPGGRLVDGKPTDILEVYDPRRNTWETRASLPSERSGYALAAFDGRLYLFGGWNGIRAVRTVYEYDPIEDAWKERTPLPTARTYAGAAVAAGKIFVIGGFDGEKALAVNEAYYPHRDQVGEDPWESFAPLPEGRYGMGVASLAEIIYLVGGKTEGGDAFQPVEYVAQSNEWELFETPLTQIGGNLVLTASQMHIYAMGGDEQEGLSRGNQVYQALYIISIPSLSK